jgi:hypothetical protein
MMPAGMPLQGAPVLGFARRCLAAGLASLFLMMTGLEQRVCAAPPDMATGTAPVLGLTLPVLPATKLPVHAPTIEMNLPALPMAGMHDFYLHLLNEALEVQGYRLVPHWVHGMPQSRMKNMLLTGELSLYWFMATRERDQTYVPVKGGLTQGLVGQRILLIRRKDQPVFSSVKTLDDLRNLGLVAGMGRGWADVQIWRQNGLRVTEQGTHIQSIMPMLAAGNRGVDYISRGATEIIYEQPDSDDLAIEESLLIVQPHDFQFYLAPSSRQIAPLLQEGLDKLARSGRHKALIDAYFKEKLKSLRLERRTVIALVNGASVAETSK